MKVINENIDNTSRRQKEIIEDKHKPISFSLAENDVHALRTAMSHYGIPYAEKAIRRLISERNQIEELVLSKTGRHMNPAVIYFETDEANRLVSEAEKLGLHVSEYIRGIIYTRTQQLIKEQVEKRERMEQRRKESRIITLELIIDKELREKLYQKFGRLSDDELREHVISECYKFLGDVES